MSDAKSVLKMIQEKEVKFVDLRFTDPRGKWQHVTFDLSLIDEDAFTQGLMFDGSSIAGWKAINESDMTLMPDPSTAVIDPFFAQTTLSIVVRRARAAHRPAYNRCPRSIAKAAEKFLKSTGIGDTCYFGPEAEFFIFDERPFRHGHEQGLLLHRIRRRALQQRHRVRDRATSATGRRSRADTSRFRRWTRYQDIRSEMLAVMGDMGIEPEKHHHEVAPSQHELGFKFKTLTKTGDAMQIYKYVIHQVAASYGKTATFMPKPIYGDNGSGMHVHQSIWKEGKPLFAGSGYADLSNMCLYYIGGIIKHAKAINAFTNSLTNSYKRLIPGFEAPVLLAYSARNRSASCRIPFAPGPKGKRVEVRFPDPGSNPYLACAAMLMAGIDGIENKIHPGEPMDKDLYSLPPEELKDIPQVCGSLRDALSYLDAGRSFLKKGGVFTDDFIDSISSSRWAKCMPSSTRRTRSSSRCTTRSKDAEARQ